MRDIASAAGVSQGAVSLALNGKPGVGETTRARILKVAEELGYRPDPRLAVLSNRRWRRRGETENGERIAVVSAVLHRPEYADLAGGIRRQAAMEGYGIEWLKISEVREARVLERICRARGIRGILLMEGARRRISGAWDLDGMALVQCDAVPRGRGFSAVMPDLMDASERLLAFLEDKPHERIAFATFASRDTALDIHREGAIHRMIRRLGDRCLKHPVFIGEEETQAADFRRWVARAKPDLVIGMNPFYAWQLREMGLSMPGDIACVSFDDVKSESWMTGYGRNQRQIGMRSLRLLTGKLTREELGRDAPVDTVLIPQIWNEGETV